jgi:Tfp pilus assembly protein PilE
MNIIYPSHQNQYQRQNRNAKTFLLSFLSLYLDYYQNTPFMSQQKRLFLFDAYVLIFRGYHAFIKPSH